MCEAARLGSPFCVKFTRISRMKFSDVGLQWIIAPRLSDPPQSRAVTESALLMHGIVLRIMRKSA